MSAVKTRSLLKLFSFSKFCNITKSQVHRCNAALVTSRHLGFSGTAWKPVEVDVKQNVASADGFVSPKDYPPLDAKTEKEYFEDFKFYLSTNTKKDDELADDRFMGVGKDEKPLVIIFGWAGANEKNISKYSDVYRDAGCITLCYNLPTRFILELTSQTPYLTDRLVREMEEQGILNRPIIVHSLSDTGLMVYQGLQLSVKHRNRSLDIRGMILDSCPGERPELNLPKLMAMIVVKWVCSRRDKMSYTATILDELRFMKERVWPAALSLMKGRKPDISVMDNLWCGDTIRMAPPQHKWPELFLYSKTDFYLNYKYLEEAVIDKHVREGRDVYTKRWDKSPHVCHLKNHRKGYIESLYNFIDAVYFSNIRK